MIKIAKSPAPLPSLPDALWRELRTSHAGAAGAVAFYRGMRRSARDPELVELLSDQLKLQENQRDFFTVQLPTQWRSLWTPVWSVFGHILGFWSGLVSSQAAYQTIDAVDTATRRHYDRELQTLRQYPEAANWVDGLNRFERDHIDNRDEVRDRLLEPPNWRVRAWHWLIRKCARVGVAISRRL